MREARRWDPNGDGMGSSPRGRASRRAALVAYLQMAPAAEVIDACRRCEDGGAETDGGAESTSPSPFGDAAQDALHRCVTHPIATSHPPDREYVARLLKLATLEAERSGRELSDRVGDLVTRTFTRCDGADGAGWCHKTYVYRHPTSDAEQRPDRDDDDVNDVNDDDDIRDAPSVSFRMHRNMFEGGTGCHEWHAAIYLAELALTHPKLFEHRRVVELGSGCGVAATVMARGNAARGVRGGWGPVGAPSRLVLTDADAGALANLERNLAANDVRVERYESNDESNEPSNDESNDDDVRACSVRTARLNWEDLEAGDYFGGGGSRPRVDLVVASDVLYDPLNVTPLLNACERILGDVDGDGESAPPGTIPGDGESAPRPWHEDAISRPSAIFVTTLRQPETLALFERVAAERGFEPRDVTAEVFGAIGATGLFEDVRGLDRREMRVHELRPPRGWGKGGEGRDGLNRDGGSTSY